MQYCGTGRIFYGIAFKHNCNVGDSKKRVTGSINEIMVGSEEEDEYEPTDRK
jgi:hypothetical protein